jgi:hypothetical protein
MWLASVCIAGPHHAAQHLEDICALCTSALCKLCAITAESIFTEFIEHAFHIVEAR